MSIKKTFCFVSSITKLPERLFNDPTFRNKHKYDLIPHLKLDTSPLASRGAQEKNGK